MKVGATMIELRNGAWYSLPDGTPLQVFQQGFW
jgi:hypothetical protein